MPDQNITASPEKFGVESLGLNEAIEQGKEIFSSQNAESPKPDKEIVLQEITGAGTANQPQDNDGTNPTKFQKALKVIEDVFSRDENFRKMLTGMQRQKAEDFAKKGEVMSLGIFNILEKIGDVIVPKDEIKKIMSLIISWLRTIPGVSKYYIEQEAKIKTEQILDELNLRRASD